MNGYLNAQHHHALPTKHLLNMARPYKTLPNCTQRIAIFYPNNIKWRTKSSHNKDNHPINQPWLGVRLNIIPVTGTIS